MTASDRVDGPYPYYGANGQQGSVDDYIFDEPLVLIAEDGGHFGEPQRGVAYRIEGKTWVNNHAHVLRPKPGVDVGFLTRALEHYEFGPYVSGSTRAKLTKSKASEVPVPLPPLPEQRRIASILDQADALRAKRRRALGHLDDLSESVFVDMFGNTASNSRMFPELLFSEIGALDRGVSRARPRNDPELLGGAHPLIQTGDIASSGGYIQAYWQSYSDKGLAQSKIWPVGTLAITIAANIAKTGILTFDACFPDSVVGFTPDRRLVDVEYVRFWLRSLQSVLERQATSSAQKNINLAVLRALHVPVPDLYTQNLFNERLAKINLLRETHMSSLLRLDELFASIQRRAFKGEM